MWSYGSAAVNLFVQHAPINSNLFAAPSLKLQECRCSLCELPMQELLRCLLRKFSFYLTIRVRRYLDQRTAEKRSKPEAGVSQFVKPEKNTEDSHRQDARSKQQLGEHFALLVPGGRHRVAAEAAASSWRFPLGLLWPSSRVAVVPDQGQSL